MHDGVSEFLCCGQDWPGLVLLLAGGDTARTHVAQSLVLRWVRRHALQTGPLGIAAPVA